MENKINELKNTVMPNYPVMYTLRDVVSGEGFLAGVTVWGHALMVQEDDGSWWVYGVRPGAIAEFGTTPQEAFHKFRDRYKTLLFDYATEVPDFETFKKEVEAFYTQPNAEEEQRWAEAFKAIRNGEVKIEAPFTELPKQSPETRPTGITILPLHQLQRFTATDNVPDQYAFAAAA